MSIKTLFADIATAIKEKNTDIVTVTPANMPQAIRSIVTGVPLYTSSAWEALTTEEKQALELVAIQNTDSGYERGILVNGADYIAPSNYIPYSEGNNIICESSLDNFSASALTWGDGTNPINLSDTVELYSDNESVYIPALANGLNAKIDLGGTDLNYTAYFVGKLVSQSTYNSIFGSSYGGVSYTGAQLFQYNSSLHITTWGVQTSLHKSPYDYFVAAIKYDNSQDATSRAKGFTTTRNASVRSDSNPQYIGIGRYAVSNDQLSNVAVKYIGVVNTAENDSIIQQNLDHLTTIFS